MSTAVIYLYHYCSLQSVCVRIQPGCFYFNVAMNVMYYFDTEENLKTTWFSLLWFLSVFMDLLLTSDTLIIISRLKLPVNNPSLAFIIKRHVSQSGHKVIRHLWKKIWGHRKKSHNNHHHHHHRIHLTTCTPVHLYTFTPEPGSNGLNRKWITVSSKDLSVSVLIQRLHQIMWWMCFFVCLFLLMFVYCF